MGMIAKTLTKGFRTSFFRNQPVHQFYGHLQAVLKDIDPSGQMNSLFARPETSAANAGEVEWSSELNGDPISFKDLPSEKQQEVAALLAAYIDKIRKYADEKQNKTGIEKDYAEYLRAVAMSPDLNQVFVVSNRPVLVHWGFICDSDNHPGQGIYAGWDEFIAQVQRKTAKAPEPEKKATPEKKSNAEQAAAAAAVFAAPPPQQKPEEKAEEKASQDCKPEPAAQKVEEPPQKTPEKAEEKKETQEKPKEPVKDDPNQEKPLLALGLGAYRWVKWLAIVLAIIILLLLLLKMLMPRNPMGGMGMPPGMSAGGGGMPSLQDLLGGGMPGGGGGLPGGGGSGMPSGGSGNGDNQGSQGGKTPGLCPHCGHSIESHGGQAPQPAPKQSQQPKQEPKQTEAQKEPVQEPAKTGN